MLARHRLILLRVLYPPSARFRRGVQENRWVRRWAHTTRTGSWVFGDLSHAQQVYAKRRRSRK